MNVPDIIIAIDGYSSTGKSTFAKLAANAFSFLYLDSGAMYRGVTLYALEHGMTSKDNTIDTAAIVGALGDIDVTFRSTPNGSFTYLGGRCIEDDIRTLEVSSFVSPVSAIPEVRKYVDARLHALAEGGKVVMDGRDIGTTVFPDAHLKIFMTASLEVRARRRYDEMIAKGQTPSFDDVLKNLQDRDYYDSHREVSPLTRAADAFVLDNSAMTLDEELIWLRGLIQGRFGILE